MRRFEPVRRSRWRSRSTSLGNDPSALEASGQAFWAAAGQVSETKIATATRNQALLGSQIAQIEAAAERSSNQLFLASGDFCRACTELKGAASLAEEVREVHASLAAMLDQAEELRQLLESEPFVLGGDDSDGGDGGDDSYASADFSVAYRDL